MMDTARLDQKMSIIINGGDGVYVMTFSLKLPDKIHPEIKDVPGRVEDDRNFHLAKNRNLVCTKQGLRSRSTIEKALSSELFLQINATKLKKSNPLRN